MLTKTRRVMFVDDEEGVRSSWDRLLSERGFSVTTVEDGERAISQLRDEPAEVVVSDLKMPGVDGLQLLEWLHESQPQTRFILLTGYGNDVVERRARELGAYEYLNKPISPETLSMVITAAMQLGRRSGSAATAQPAAAVVVESAAAAREQEAPILQAGVVAEAAPVVDARAVAADEEDEEGESALKTAAKLALAPIAGLAFVIFLPVIGFGMLFWVAGQAIRKHRASATA